MRIKRIFLSFLVGMAGFCFLGDLSADIITNNFDGVADDIGPALQEIDNGVGTAGTGPSTFNPATGVAVGNGGNNSTVGFNSIALAALAPDTTAIQATFVVSSADAADISANGFFFGLVTGTNATVTNGPGLFNNDPTAVGILVENDTNPNDGVSDNLLLVTDPGTPALSEAVLATGFPTVASQNDGFTVDFTIFADDTFSATTTGLSNDVTAVTGALPGVVTFNDFLTGGVGVNGTIQTGTTGGGFTIDSVTVQAIGPAPVIPEPSSIALVGMLALGLVTRRRRS